jgi:hypothetical protein
MNAICADRGLPQILRNLSDPEKPLSVRSAFVIGYRLLPVPCALPPGANYERLM